MSGRLIFLGWAEIFFYNSMLHFEYVSMQSTCPFRPRWAANKRLEVLASSTMIDMIKLEM